MAEEHCEREIGAPRVVDTDEGCVRDDVERLLAAIIRVRAPANVGEQTSGMAIALLVGGLVEPGGRHEAVGPADEFLAVGGRTRAQQVEVLGGGEERIARALLRVEQRIKQPLAHAERGNHHLPRPRKAHHVLEHERRIAEQRPARVVDHLDAREHVRIDAMREAGKLQRLAGGNAVAVHHVQRIAGLPHVQPGERAPGAADRIERAPFAGGERRHVVERLFDDFVRLLERLCRNILERQSAERQGHAGFRPRAMHVNEFERAAAEIADDAVGTMEAGEDAERRVMRFAPAREHVDLGTADLGGLGNEGAPVGGVAAGGGREHPQLAHAHGIGQRAESAQRVQRLVGRLGVEEPGRLHLAPEAGQHLFVEGRGRAARQTFVDDDAHRVRPDVDDGDRRPMIEAALRLGLGRRRPPKRGHAGGRGCAEAIP